MGINKFDQARLSSLKKGDRFYIGSNKSKIFEFVGKAKKSFSGNYEFMYSDGRNDIISKSDRVVIFLRNINDK